MVRRTAFPVRRASPRNARNDRSVDCLRRRRGSRSGGTACTCSSSSGFLPRGYYTENDTPVSPEQQLPPGSLAPPRSEPHREPTARRVIGAVAPPQRSPDRRSQRYPEARPRPCRTSFPTPNAPPPSSAGTSPSRVSIDLRSSLMLLDHDSLYSGTLKLDGLSSISFNRFRVYASAAACHDPRSSTRICALA